VGEKKKIMRRMQIKMAISQIKRRKSMILMEAFRILKAITTTRKRKIRTS